MLDPRPRIKKRFVASLSRSFLNRTRSSPRPRPSSKITRERLLRSLQIIGTIPAPLPPELPPSPPASRSTSPATLPSVSSSKRKLDTSGDTDSAKRPRTGKHAAASGSAPTPSSSVTSVVSSSTSSETALSSVPSTNDKTKEAGKSSAVAGASTAGDASTRALTVYEPVRRPRHGRDTLDFRAMHKMFYAQARQFKYSGEARFLSTYPQSHAYYRPLKEPPAKSTPYHTHGGLMALLESLEGLLCFVYAAWCQDHSYSGPFNDAWETIPSYLHWCKQNWKGYVREESVREKSFLGLIHMIAGFTHQRIVRYKLSPALDYKSKQYLTEIEEAAKAQAAAETARPTNAKATPPEKSLPSPDTDAASANSTPANPGNSTPANASENRNDEAKRNGNKQPPTRPPAEGDPTISVKQSYISSAKRLVSQQAAASEEMRNSEKNLSLPTMREHFPRTFGRMVCSTLSAEEEYEPDMEDADGELFWPSQCVTGDGIAWVCLMGRAMVREFGREIGYTSMDGIIAKPVGTASG
ncbi:hypothetical protein DFH11DRAFT_1501327 [Phellopilus nigrolimitatus]|nr:hypothetical protein DFH11DRAFT_1501327 [Phellopilus nigrolimitatus]